MSVLSRPRAEGAAESLQERMGGLDGDVVGAVSLDDVSINATEIVELILQMADGVCNMTETREVHLQEMENEATMEIDKSTTQLLIPSLAPVSSGTRWVCISRGGCPARARAVSKRSAESSTGYSSGYYAVLRTCAGDDDETYCLPMSNSLR